ncbi:hypothetical protein C8R44DRAFT_94676 [Mycena epipterygia]|nr:hypothetical protein C8R44DRAFT_94676 [Mycena epipterygia]
MASSSSSSGALTRSNTSSTRRPRRRSPPTMYHCYETSTPTAPPPLIKLDKKLKSKPSKSQPKPDPPNPFTVGSGSLSAPLAPATSKPSPRRPCILPFLGRRKTVSRSETIPPSPIRLSGQSTPTSRIPPPRPRLSSEAIDAAEHIPWRADKTNRLLRKSPQLSKRRHPLPHRDDPNASSISGTARISPRYPSTSGLDQSLHAHPRETLDECFTDDSHLQRESTFLSPMEFAASSRPPSHFGSDEAEGVPFLDKEVSTDPGDSLAECFTDDSHIQRESTFLLPMEFAAASRPPSSLGSDEAEGVHPLDGEWSDECFTDDSHIQGESAFLLPIEFTAASRPPSSFGSDEADGVHLLDGEWLDADDSQIQRESTFLSPMEFAAASRPPSLFGPDEVDQRVSEKEPITTVSPHDTRIQPPGQPHDERSESHATVQDHSHSLSRTPTPHRIQLLAVKSRVIVAQGTRSHGRKPSVVRTEPGWMGEWNQDDMQDVIGKLRSLK